MRNEFAKCEIKTSVFSGRKPQAGNCCRIAVNNLLYQMLNEFEGCQGMKLLQLDVPLLFPLLSLP